MIEGAGENGFHLGQHRNHDLRRVSNSWNYVYLHAHSFSVADPAASPLDLYFQRDDRTLATTRGTFTLGCSCLRSNCSRAFCRNSDQVSRNTGWRPNLRQNWRKSDKRRLVRNPTSVASTILIKSTSCFFLSRVIFSLFFSFLLFSPCHVTTREKTTKDSAAVSSILLGESHGPPNSPPKQLNREFRNTIQNYLESARTASSSLGRMKIKRICNSAASMKHRNSARCIIGDTRANSRQDGAGMKLVKYGRQKFPSGHGSANYRPLNGTKRSPGSSSREETKIAKKICH